MIKRIKVHELQVGMFIHDFQCEWNHTLFIDKMLVSNLQVIEILKNWDIKEVLIDTARGIDFTKSPIAPPAQAMPSAVPFQIEVQQAEKIKNEAVATIKDIMRQAREGKPLSMNSTYDLAGKMLASVRRNRDALVLLSRIREKDEYTHYHSLSVSTLMLAFCEYKGIPEKRSLELAVGGLLHDIGKTMIPDFILKKPAKLTPKEFEIMKQHAEFSMDILYKIKNIPLECLDIALHHHERIDGSGYPHGFGQKKLGTGAQMTAICDVFDAITSVRCYKNAMSTVSGLKVLYENSGSHFHKEMAYEFIECMGVYPIGSCVRLSDGRVGIVAGSTDNLLKPIVKVFHDERRKERFSPFTVDLSSSDTTVMGYEKPQNIGLTPVSAIAAVCQQ